MSAVDGWLLYLFPSGRMGPGLWSRRILGNFDSDPDSGLKIPTPTLAQTPLRLRPNERCSILKGALWCGPSSWFPFRLYPNEWYGNTVSRTPGMQPALSLADSHECGRHDSLWIYRHSHTTITTALKSSPMPFVGRNSITTWRFNFIFAPPPSFSPCPMFSEGLVTVWSKSS